METNLTNNAQKLVDAFDKKYQNLVGPFDDNWQELCIAQTLRELIKQCSYNHFHLDGDHGINVINVKDIKKIIEELETPDPEEYEYFHISYRKNAPF